jgi:trans-2,3-dihydro-3-hydroxyanthranilate isomerase
MQLQYHTVDVFSDTPLGGNPLSVVLGADDLSEAQMQAIAREFALSETAFILAPQNKAHSARVRLFTPLREVPFSGHSSLGVAAVLANNGQSEVAKENDCLVILEQTIGTVRVGVRLEPGKAAFAEFDAPKRPIDAGVLPPVETLAAAVNLIPNEIGFENHKPVCFAAGDTFAFVPVASLEALKKAKVMASRWAAGFEEQGVLGAYLYTRQCLSKDSSFHARMFAPGAGIPEDPASGSAAVCFAGLIKAYDRLPNGTHKRTIEQGFEIGRPSHVTLFLEIEGGEMSAVRISGRCVRVCSGTMSLAGV